MNFTFKKNIIKFKRFIIDLIKIAIGTLIMAIGIEQFLLPSQLSTGGFSGIGTIIYYLTGISVGITMLVLNIPLFIIAYFKVGKKFFIKAILGTIIFSVFLNVFENIKPITQDRILASIYGAILVGVGTAIVLKANGSTGGTELIANVIKAYKGTVKTGTVIVVLDTIIVMANTIFFGEIEIALYSTLAIYILGKVLDIFFEGIDFAKMLIIISPKCQEISDKISEEIKRGTTALYGKGMYKKENREILLSVMSRAEIREARQIIAKIDPSAFIIITNAREVYGKGFKEK